MRMSYSKPLSIVFVMMLVQLISIHLQAQIQFDEQQLDSIIEFHSKRHRIPQVSVSVVWRDSIIYNKEFGSTASKPQSYYIGSVSKTFTALAIAQLKDQGLLDFDDKVATHLTDFHVPDVTIRQLLSHTSGFSQYAGHDLKAQETGEIQHISLKNKPGEKFEYSSLNYIVLGKLIEYISALPYAEYMEKHIFTPLEMSSTYVAKEAFRPNHLATGNQYWFGFIKNAPLENPPHYLIPAGFIITNGRDMAHYLSIFLNKGQYNNQQIIQASTLEEMLTPYFGGQPGNGLAWGIGAAGYSHAGNARGYSNRSFIFPKEELAISVMSNINNGPFFDGNTEILKAVSSTLRGKPFKRNWISEWHFSLLLLLLVLVDLYGFGKNMFKWSKLGFPLHIVKNWKITFRIARGILVAAVLLIALPIYIGIPLRIFWEYFSEMGAAITIGAFTSLFNGIIKGFLMSDKAMKVV